MRLWLLAAFAAILTSARDVAAQSSSSTTKDGVYSVQQAVRGRDLYAGNCRSCHTPEAHAGETFNATWKGRGLAELYTYLREQMPKNEPGSLTEQEYADVLAYMLRLNRMPAGQLDLPADTTALRKIRIEGTDP